MSRKGGAIPPASNNNTLSPSSDRCVARIVPALPAPTEISSIKLIEIKENIMIIKVDK